MEEYKCQKEDSIANIQLDVREIRKDVKLLLRETSALKAKAMLWGSFGGIIIPSILGLVLWLLGVTKV